MYMSIQMDGSSLSLVLLISVIFISSVLSDPCHVIPESNDEDFMKLTLVDLYNDPEDFFYSDVAKKCNLKYIDLVSEYLVSCMFSSHFFPSSSSSSSSSYTLAL